MPAGFRIPVLRLPDHQIIRADGGSQALTLLGSGGQKNEVIPAAGTRARTRWDLRVQSVFNSWLSGRAAAPREKSEPSPKLSLPLKLQGLS